MKTLRFFIVPILAGWAAAFALCFVLHFGSHLLRHGQPLHRSAAQIASDYAFAFLFGGMTIVLPVFLLVVLPLSIIDYRLAPEGRSLDARIYVAGILLAGLFATLVFYMKDMTDIFASAGELRLLLFFAPFIPFSIVIALTARRLRRFRLVENPR